MKLVEKNHQISTDHNKRVWFVLFRGVKTVSLARFGLIHPWFVKNRSGRAGQSNELDFVTRPVLGWVVGSTSWTTTFFYFFLIF